MIPLRLCSSPYYRLVWKFWLIVAVLSSCSTPHPRHVFAFLSQPRTAFQRRAWSSSLSSSSSNNNIRFLGKGEHAIVRPGVVLIAPQHEYHHYYRQAAIFVYAMGEDDYGVYVVRGVIIDHPTPFTLQEMTDDNPAIHDSPLSNNLLFRGGDKGGDGVILLHHCADLGQSAIGVSGIYQGGWQAALEACKSGNANPDDFKVFFNYCEFTEQELEDMLAGDEEGDAWASVEVGTDLVLDPDWDRGEAWKKLRNAVAQMTSSS